MSDTPATPAASFTMPIALADLTDDALRRYESFFRAERLRRARDAAHIAAPASDPDDAILEMLTAEQIDAIARRQDAEIYCTGRQLGGHGGGLA